MLDTTAAKEQIKQDVDRFTVITQRLKKMVSGLAVTRVICRIESASVLDDTSSIDEISTRLTEFQNELGKSLDRITNSCDKLVRNIPHRLDVQRIEAQEEQPEAAAG